MYHSGIMLLRIMSCVLCLGWMLVDLAGWYLNLNEFESVLKKFELCAMYCLVGKTKISSQGS